MLIFTLVFLVAVLYYMYFRRMRKALYECSDTLPDIGSLPVLGHTHWFIGGPEKLLKNIQQLLEIILSNGGFSKLWIGPSLYVVTFNPDDVQKILEQCLDKDMTYKFIRKWLGNGLFVAQVGLWKMHRRFLLPIFNSHVVEDFIDIFDEQASVLVERLEKKCGQPEFDVYPFATACMLDIVFETAMGERMDVQHNPETPYLRARHSVMSIINMRLFKAWMQPDAIFNLTPYAKIQQEGIDTTHQFTDEVVRKKRIMAQNGETVNKGRRDMLELLMAKDNNFSDLQLREHIDSITIAGNDTTALVIAYVLLVLGHYQNIQDKVYQELQSVFDNKKRSPTREDLTKMEYMERVIKETMRHYNVVPIIGRRTDKEVKLSKCTLPAGVGCAIVPYVLHMSKELWGPDAEEFNPDRFLPENSVGRHPCAFLPFSHGTRNCIGRHFGMLAMKSIISNVIWHYRIKSSLKVCERMEIRILLFPVAGHLITIEKRN